MWRGAHTDMAPVQYLGAMWNPTILASLTLSLGALTFTMQDEPTDTPDDDEPVAVVGDESPTFTLNDAKGALVTVGGEQERWTVLAFYPKALTGG